MHTATFIDKLGMKIRNKDFTLVEEHALVHNDHCFNYLRNAILCCGDITLEGQTLTPERKDVASTDGTGVVHACRNYVEIVSWAEKKMVYDSEENL
jgi:hypothetical protein